MPRMAALSPSIPRPGPVSGNKFIVAARARHGSPVSGCFDGRDHEEVPEKPVALLRTFGSWHDREIPATGGIAPADGSARSRLRAAPISLRWVRRALRCQVCRTTNSHLPHLLTEMIYVRGLVDGQERRDHQLTGRAGSRQATRRRPSRNIPESA